MRGVSVCGSGGGAPPKPHLQGELSSVNAQVQASQGGCRRLPNRQGQAHLSSEASLATQQAPFPTITSSHLALNFPEQLAAPELSA